MCTAAPLGAGKRSKAAYKLGGPSIGSGDPLTRGGRTATVPAVKLATWNVNSLKIRLPRVLELLADHAPDIALLQETKSEPDAFPVDELRAAGYHSAHHSAGRWAGVALLAREALGDVCAGLAGEPAVEEARWIEATTADGLRLASVYVPNGRTIDHPEFEKKLAFLDAARERVGTLDV